MAISTIPACPILVFSSSNTPLSRIGQHLTRPTALQINLFVVAGLPVPGAFYLSTRTAVPFRHAVRQTCMADLLAASSSRDIHCATMPLLRTGWTTMCVCGTWACATHACVFPAQAWAPVQSHIDADIAHCPRRDSQVNDAMKKPVRMPVSCTVAVNPNWSPGQDTVVYRPKNVACIQKRIALPPVAARLKRHPSTKARTTAATQNRALRPPARFRVGFAVSVDNARGQWCGRNTGAPGAVTQQDMLLPVTAVVPDAASNPVLRMAVSTQRCRAVSIHTSHIGQTPGTCHGLSLAAKASTAARSGPFAFRPEGHGFLEKI